MEGCDLKSNISRFQISRGWHLCIYDYKIYRHLSQGILSYKLQLYVDMCCCEGRVFNVLIPFCLEQGIEVDSFHLE